MRQVPVACYRHDDFVTVVASNNGLPKDPVWWLNLKAKPEVEAQLGTQRQKVCAVMLEGEEREKAWEKIIQKNPRQKAYAEGVERQLPVVYLKPIP